MLAGSLQYRSRQCAFESTAAALQGLVASAATAFRSKARGRSGPLKSDQPVGGWR